MDSIYTIGAGRSSDEWSPSPTGRRGARGAEYARCRLAIGIIDVALMMPLSMPDKRAALLGPFCARFALGFFASVAQLPVSPVVTGIVVGMLTSLPDAIITKAYAPILGAGVVFGAVAGWSVGRRGVP